jgi:putative transposase
MPYRREQFVNGEIYHITARRINDKLLFEVEDDYYRGIFSIYEFNTVKSVEIRVRRKIRAQLKLNQANGGPTSVDSVDTRDPLVEVLAFCFMPNHIHLLLRQLKDNGITKFMSKFGTGYSAYFKQKHNIKDKGYFFNGRFFAVHIKNDEQLKIAFAYIHANPVSLIEPEYKEAGIKNPEKAILFLENNYKWSSYLDYIRKKNFPSITKRDFLSETMGGIEGCKDFMDNWIRYKEKRKEFKEFDLD